MRKCVLQEWVMGLTYMEIMGYKHANEEWRRWWHALYLRLVNDAHLRPETEERMDSRLGDREDTWREAEEVIAQ